MSVHKAGICFGVPHSTLEYKVKERTSSNENYLNNKLSLNGSSFFSECLNNFWPNNQPASLDKSDISQEFTSSTSFSTNPVQAHNLHEFFSQNY